MHSLPIIMFTFHLLRLPSILITDELVVTFMNMTLKQKLSETLVVPV
jgi:hypothetical protein